MLLSIHQFATFSAAQDKCFACSTDFKIMRTLFASQNATMKNGRMLGKRNTNNLLKLLERKCAGDERRDWKRANTLNDAIPKKAEAENCYKIYICMSSTCESSKENERKWSENEIEGVGEKEAANLKALAFLPDPYMNLCARGTGKRRSCAKQTLWCILQR